MMLKVKREETSRYLNSKTYHENNKEDEVESLSFGYEHIPVLHTSAVYFIKELHQYKCGEHHGSVLTWLTDRSRTVTKACVRKIREHVN